MKKQLLKAGAVVAVAGVAVGASALAANHYSDYQTNKNKQEAAKVAAIANVEKQRQDQEKQLQADVVKYKALYNSQVAECGKGRAIYDRLTPLIKAQFKAPTCGTPVVP